MSRSLLAQWRDDIRGSGVGHSAKCVGYTLSTYMNGSGQAYPGIRASRRIVRVRAAPSSGRSGSL